MENQIYKNKYIKYKNKYLNLKKMIGGNNDENLDFFLNFNIKKDIYIEKYLMFKDIDLINYPISNIGVIGDNGFIKLFEYKNNIDSKKFKTILKTSLRKDTDNNYYEYLVGNCINIIKEYLPNFVYTFLYMNPTESLQRELKSNMFADNNLLKREINIKSDIKINELGYFENIGNGCENNKNSSILLEYIPNSYNIDNILFDSDFILNYDYNLFCILFQVYAALVCLKDIYTHYDLHPNNVMIIKLPKKMLITYSNLNIQLYTMFMPVIIDYGRSYIDCRKFGLDIDSKFVGDIACINIKCNDNLIGYDDRNCNTVNNGLNIIKHNNVYSDQNDFYYINLLVKNESIDVRYIIRIMEKIPDIQSKIKRRFVNIFNNIINPEWYTNTGLRTTYGVKQMSSTYLISKKISTTIDVLEWLKEIYNTFNYSAFDFNLDNCYGEININTNIDDKIKWSYKSKEDIIRLLMVGRGK